MILRVPLIFTAVLTLLAGSAFAQERVPLLELSGYRVSEISVEGAPLPGAELKELVPIHEGDELTPAGIRAGIQNLYSTGRFQKVDVLGRLENGLVHLRILLVPRQWVGQVFFAGNLRISNSDLLRSVEIGSRDEVDPRQLESSAARILEYYRYRGFRQAACGYELAVSTRGNTDVVFQITEGSRSQITDIVLDGDAGLSRLRFLAVIRTAPGSRLDGQELDRDVEVFTDWLKGRGFFFAQVSYSLEGLPEEASVRVVFTARTGPRFELSAKSSLEGDNRRLGRWLRESFAGASTSEEAVGRAQERIQGYYLERGYPFVNLTWSDAVPSAGTRKIGVSVEAGRPAVIGSVLVDGVEHLDTDNLHGILGLEIGSPFVRSQLDAAMKRLSTHYGRQGFGRAEVSLLPLSFSEDPGDEARLAAIHLAVSEGERRMLGSVFIVGGPYGREDGMETLGLAEGGPYVPEQVSAAREALLTRLARDGYLYAALSLDETRQDDGSTDLTLTISEGPLVRLERVILIGNEGVRGEILRQALDLDRGEVLTMEKMLAAQERVYRLRVLQSVDVRLDEREKPAEAKDLIVDVRERPRYVIGMRAGYGNEDHLRGEISFADRNVGGMARSLTFRARASDIERESSLTYTHPYFLGRQMDFSARLSDLVEKRDSYTRDSFTANLDLTRQVSARTSTRLGYSFEGLKLLDVSEGAILSPDDEGKTDLAAVLPQVIYDSRDDFLDPNTGLLGDVLLEFASRALGSEAEFYRLELAVRRYEPLGSGLVAAGMVRAGLVESYGRSEEVIISKRFFLGGQTSVRGYALDGVGPKDTDGDPIGGNIMVNANLELRYPIAGSFRGVVFADSGGLWLNKQILPDEGMRFAAGLGLRWTSPIGPLSLDYGYKLNPVGEDEKDRFRFHFSIGHAF